MAVSQNPYIAFNFKGAAKGDRIVVTWHDNKGDSRTDEALVS
jgi:sulfur-oxidizing protein SoxZ